MRKIEALSARKIGDAATHLESTLRAALADKGRDWLIDRLVDLALGEASVAESPVRLSENAGDRAERTARVRALGLDAQVIRAFVRRYERVDREVLVAEEMLSASAPKKGTQLIKDAHRDPAGERLLQFAKDLLFGLLFGDAEMGVSLRRTHRELLTLALPRAKAHCLGFMKAATVFSAAGAWQDPASVSSDCRADNVMLEIEYGEVEDELVGAAILRCLGLINALEVNEQLLYARMIDIEESSLVA